MKHASALARLALLAILVALVAAVGGCAPPMALARSSALAADDMVRMTDDMAMQMAGSPAIQQAIAEGGRLKVVVKPVENYMTAEVLSPGAANAFTARLRSLLAVHAPEKFMWIMNRDTYYRMRAAELEGVDLGPNPDAIQPQYALSARFDSITSEDPDRRSSYYLCVYELANLQSRDVLWTGKYELKKSVVKGFLD